MGIFYLPGFFCESVFLSGCDSAFGSHQKRICADLEEEKGGRSLDSGGQNRIEIDGGEGVGRVTMPGLDQPVGAAAINSVPRRMIRESVEEVCRLLDFCGKLSVEIFVPGGEAVAKQTMNGRLGIVGGISILAHR